MTPAECDAHDAALERDQQLATELGLARPYFFPGPQFGTCPGTAEYGHGLTLATVHVGCCARWDAARAEREATP
jgi:hypothetical protein